LIHIKNLRGLGLRQVFEYFSDRWICLLARAARLHPVNSYLRRINYAPKNALVAGRISLYGYHPDSYPGGLFLFRARQRPNYESLGTMEHWRSYIQGDLVIREVQGEHLHMFYEPNVKDLAQQLNECLLQVEAGQVAPALYGKPSCSRLCIGDDVLNDILSGVLAFGLLIYQTICSFEMYLCPQIFG
jgi:hypothetical protein